MPSATASLQQRAFAAQLRQTSSRAIAGLRTGASTWTFNSESGDGLVEYQAPANAATLVQHEPSPFFGNPNADCSTDSEADMPARNGRNDSSTDDSENEHARYHQHMNQRIARSRYRASDSSSQAQSTAADSGKAQKASISSSASHSSASRSRRKTPVFNAVDHLNHRHQGRRSDDSSEEDHADEKSVPEAKKRKPDTRVGTERDRLKSASSAFDDLAQSLQRAHFESGSPFVFNCESKLYGCETKVSVRCQCAPRGLCKSCHQKIHLNSNSHRYIVFDYELYEWRNPFDGSDTEILPIANVLGLGA